VLACIYGRSKLFQLTNLVLRQMTAENLDLHHTMPNEPIMKASRLLAALAELSLPLFLPLTLLPLILLPGRPFTGRTVSRKNRVRQRPDPGEVTGHLNQIHPLRHPLFSRS
jgi:hypothetical protein